MTAAADAESVAELARLVQAGSRAHLARAITLIESTRPEHRARARELLGLVQPPTEPAIRVGVTGPPGAGKSTLIDALGVRLVGAGHRVAVLAVDPSSSRTGGSVLGDRTRMEALATSEDAFVRAAPTGGHLGGVSRATGDSIRLVEAAGFDVVLIETVGVGQSEAAVAGLADTVVLVTLPGAGDQLQAIKRGNLEVADVVAVSKADGDVAAPARVAARELRAAMRLMSDGPDASVRPVITCSALTGLGLDDLWQAVLDHRAGLADSGGVPAHRERQRGEDLMAAAENALASRLRNSADIRRLVGELSSRLATGEVSLADAVDEILRLLLGGDQPDAIGHSDYNSISPVI